MACNPLLGCQEKGSSPIPPPPIDRSLWKERQPTIIDEASIGGLHELSKRPFEKSALLSELRLPDEKFQTFYDYGEQAHYLGKFNSLETGKEVIWTPLYWAGKTEAVLKYLQKQSEKHFSELLMISQTSLLTADRMVRPFVFCLA